MFGSFPPSPLVVSASKVYSGLGADIVYGIITLIVGLRHESMIPSMQDGESKGKSWINCRNICSTLIPVRRVCCKSELLPRTLFDSHDCRPGVAIRIMRFQGVNLSLH